MKYTIALIALLSLSSCYNTTIIPKGVSLYKHPHSFVSKSYFWGAIEDKRFINNDSCDCQGNGIGKMQIRTGPGGMFLRVFTLGMISHQKFTFDCATDH
ncbi:MAG: hypothetical protein IPK03_14920 [Bacteroidetes bacterium]|nr:hypothetical protein [Bacteroidota bacterium]